MQTKKNFGNDVGRFRRSMKEKSKSGAALAALQLPCCDIALTAVTVYREM